MLQCPADNILITIEKTHQDKINSIYVVTNYNPEEYVTIKGKVVSLPKSISNRHDLKGFTTDGIQIGDEVLFRYDLVHHYASQKEDTSPTYKYEIFYKGKSYWRLNIFKCFAYIRDGKINMINGYVMLESPEKQPLLYIPGHLKGIIPRTGISAVKHIGSPLTHLKPISVEVGDKVYFDAKRVQRYQIDGKEFAILKQSHILGKEAIDLFVA